MSGILSPYEVICKKDYDLTKINKEKVANELAKIIDAAKTAAHDLAPYEVTLNEDEQKYLIERIDERNDIKKQTKA